MKLHGKPHQEIRGFSKLPHLSKSQSYFAVPQYRSSMRGSFDRERGCATEHKKIKGPLFVSHDSTLDQRQYRFLRRDRSSFGGAVTV
jgi:hypothetical protein